MFKNAHTFTYTYIYMNNTYTCTYTYMKNKYTCTYTYMLNAYMIIRGEWGRAQWQCCGHKGTPKNPNGSPTSWLSVGTTSQNSVLQPFHTINWVASWLLRISTYSSAAAHGSEGRHSQIFENSALHLFYIANCVVSWLLRIFICNSAAACCEGRNSQNSQKSLRYSIDYVKWLKGWLQRIRMTQHDPQTNSVRGYLCRNTHTHTHIHTYTHNTHTHTHIHHWNTSCFT